MHGHGHLLRNLSHERSIEIGDQLSYREYTVVYNTSLSYVLMIPDSETEHCRNRPGSVLTQSSAPLCYKIVSFTSGAGQTPSKTKMLSAYLSLCEKRLYPVHFLKHYLVQFEHSLITLTQPLTGRASNSISIVCCPISSKIL